jgi:hypothetical protein
LAWPPSAGIRLVFVEMVGDEIKRAPMQALFDRVDGASPSP